MRVSVSHVREAFQQSIREKRHFRNYRRLLITAVLLLPMLFPGATFAADDDEKLTLGEFTAHVISTFEVIGEVGFNAAVAMKRTVEDGSYLAKYYADYHAEGYEEFTGGSGGGCEGPCLEFRAQFIELVAHEQEVINLLPQALGAYARIQGLEPPPPLPPADLSALLDVLEDAPAFVLYPIYDAIKTGTGDVSGSMDYLNLLFFDAQEALEGINDVGRRQAIASQAYAYRIQSTGGIQKKAAASVHGYSCQFITNERDLNTLLVAAPVLKVFAAGMYWTGDSNVLRGMNMIQKSKYGLSLVGTVSGASNVNVAAAVGEILRLIGKVSEGLSKGVFNTIHTCRLRLNNQVMFCMLTEKNLHKTQKRNTLKDCTARVKAGDENFGFNENWFDELE